MKNRLVEKKLEVNKFLGIFKKSVTKHGLTTLRRPKNLDTLTEMGFTFLDVQNEIMKLTYKDFVAGPKQESLTTGRTGGMRKAPRRGH